jgi:DNA-binding NtrC family response regulator
MVDMSGLELVEELERTRFDGKIVVFTGYLTPDAESSYRKLGIEHFFKKPFDLKRLCDLVTQIV